MNHPSVMMRSTLAIHGGRPVRKALLPYARQSIDDADIRAVTDVLKSDWLTTGPKVSEFEQEFARFVEAKEAVAVSNGTAALHTAMYALEIQPGSEVIVPSMTFAATANAVVFQGGVPVFADCDPDTLLIDPQDIARKISKKTKAVVTVDYAGQPCDYDALHEIAEKHDTAIIADACHALGATISHLPFKGEGKGEGFRKVGSLADLNCFSFHPVKPLTTGEGGMITTDDSHLAVRMRSFRNHCLSSDHRERHEKGAWEYDMTDLGYNYRLTDIQCALGISQLKKVSGWTARRQAVARMYDAAFASLSELKPLGVRSGVSHAYHLYVVLLDPDRLSVGRAEVFRALRAENIGINVHYKPVHLHGFYQKTFGTKAGQCPVAEAAYKRMISLPIFASMTDRDVQDVIAAVKKVCAHYIKTPQLTTHT